MTVLTDNIAKLDGFLERFREMGIENRIAGQDVAGSGGVFQTISPVDTSVICDVAHGTAADIDAAAQAAHAAFAAWRDLPALERKKILIRVAEGIEARAQEIALCECWDTGQAYKFMSKAALRGAENFRYFADQVVQARDGQDVAVANIAEHHDAGADWPCGCHYPVEPHRSCCRHGRSRQLWRRGCTIVHKTRRGLTFDGASVGRDCRRGWSATRCIKHCERVWRRSWQGIVRASPKSRRSPLSEKAAQVV